MYRTYADMRTYAYADMHTCAPHTYAIPVTTWQDMGRPDYMATWRHITTSSITITLIYFQLLIYSMTIEFIFNSEDNKVNDI